MRDYVDVGPAPADEDCVQVGDIDYNSKARSECERFLNLIRKKLGAEPEGARLSIKSFPHEFGSYMEVVCYYDDENLEAVDYAFRCESDAPEKWED